MYEKCMVDVYKRQGMDHCLMERRLVNLFLTQYTLHQCTVIVILYIPLYIILYTCINNILYMGFSSSTRPFVFIWWNLRVTYAHGVEKMRLYVGYSFGYEKQKVRKRKKLANWRTVGLRLNEQLEGVTYV